MKKEKFKRKILPGNNPETYTEIHENHEWIVIFHVKNNVVLYTDWVDKNFQFMVEENQGDFSEIKAQKNHFPKFSETYKI
jgi:hypothetical protein